MLYFGLIQSDKYKQQVASEPQWEMNNIDNIVSEQHSFRQICIAPTLLLVLIFLRQKEDLITHKSR